MTPPRDITTETYDFQREAVAFILERHGLALIADEVGLGKTVEALAWASYADQLRPAVVICPAQIKLQWARAITEWLPDPQITIVKGTRAAPIEGEWIIVNWDNLHKRLGDLKALGPRLLVFDESHYAKEAQARRSKAARALADHHTVLSKLGLTGTPVLNRPRELWHQTQLIAPRVFPSFWTFAMDYCNPKRVPTTAKRDRAGNVLKDQDGNVRWNYSWDCTGASNTDRLNDQLRAQVMIRRRKADVFHQMPERQRVTVPFEVDLEGAAAWIAWSEVRARLLEYRAAMMEERDEIASLRGRAQSAAVASRAEDNSTKRLSGYLLGEITLAKKEAALAKLPQAITWILDHLDTGEPLVVFAHHHIVLDTLAASLTAHGITTPPPLDGRMTVKRREKAVAAFVGGDAPVLLCGITAMGTGVDGLQHRASHCAFVEMAWGPAAHEQCEGRLHRAGQHNAVTSYYLVAAGTIEEQIARLVDAKGSVTSASVGELDDLGILESIAGDLEELEGQEPEDLFHHWPGSWA